MMKPYRRDLKELSQNLRSNLTDAEQLLWKRLRHRQMQNLHFYRQKPLLDYIVDFYCPRAKLVIELDGSQHLTEMGMTNDFIRDQRLLSIGLKVLRFNNLQVLQEIEAVLETINAVIQGQKD